jgi:hypothetical protein
MQTIKICAEYLTECRENKYERRKFGKKQEEKTLEICTA